jgi:hypothetical protein
MCHIPVDKVAIVQFQGRRGLLLSYTRELVQFLPLGGAQSPLENPRHANFLLQGAHTVNTNSPLVASVLKYD